ncbi:EIF2AK1 [Acanthosepion pharaonis]|uniref:non-specific serine/threonine protein kinase n=1 Tax=Acanthosepion pharaonis TaxID=158019 RepID=A0A812DUQ6_ACAPH|nr:EIF2AK1 [Sepia pharaonis]
MSSQEFRCKNCKKGKEKLKAEIFERDIINYIYEIIKQNSKRNVNASDIQLGPSNVGLSFKFMPTNSVLICWKINCDKELFEHEGFKKLFEMSSQKLINKFEVPDDQLDTLKDRITFRFMEINPFRLSWTITCERKEFLHWIMESNFDSREDVLDFMKSLYCKDPTSLTYIRSEGRYTKEYEEIGLLGEGGFGSVYKACNKKDGKYYAIKKISFHDFPDSASKIFREVKALFDLKNVICSENISPSSFAVTETNYPVDSELSDGATSEEQNLTEDTSNELRNKQNQFTLFIQMELCKETLKDWLQKTDSTNSSKSVLSSVSHHLTQHLFSLWSPPLLPQCFPFNSLHLPATSEFSSVSHHLIQEPFPCSPHHICHNSFPFNSLHLPSPITFVTILSPFHSLHLPATSVFSSVSHHLIQEPFPCSPHHILTQFFPFFIPYICLPQSLPLLTQCFPFSFLTSACHKCIFLSVPPLDPRTFFPCSPPSTFDTILPLFHSLHLPATSAFSSVSHHLIQEPFPCSPHHILTQFFSLLIPYICLPQVHFSSVSHHLIQEPFSL